MSHILPFVFLFIFSTSFAAENTTLAELGARLANTAVVQGKFKQVRIVKDLDLRLESSGDFKFIRPMQLEWNQKQPFVQDLEMNENKLVQRSSTGHEQVITKSQQPVVFSFSSSFVAVFSGDTSHIDRDFKYQISTENKKWILSLEPKESLMLKVILKIKLSGAQFIDRVEVTEKSGNSTTITFFDVKGT